MKNSPLRELIGFFVAPAVLPMILFLATLTTSPAWEAAFFAKILAAFGYLSALVIGVPLHLFLRWRKMITLKLYLAAGAATGFICYATVFGALILASWSAYPEHSLLFLKNSIGSAIMAIVCGFVASLAFWLIAVRRLRAL